MEFVVSIVKTVVGYATAPVGRQCGYLIFHKSNLDSLRNQRVKLEEKIRTVQQSVEVAERNLEVIKPDVVGWMQRAEKCSQEAESILDQYDNEASKWCPNMKSRYSLSRKAIKKATEVGEIRNEGHFDKVSDPAPPPPVESTISREGLIGFESRREIENEVMKALKDENENMIGICGMGGVGKTTMAKEIIIRVKEEKLVLFDHVVMATISKAPNKRRIQGEIADCLGMKLDAESTDGRARRLFEKMKDARIFVVLDDIWERLELRDIGIPFGEDRKGCKILLTSRNKEVVKGMGAKNIFVAPVLTKEEAWSLFKEKAGISHDVPSNLLSKRKAVAEECGGLPLAIVCVAAALNGKAEYIWDDALLQLRQCIVANIGEVDKRVHKSLEFSYEQLASEEAKKCFLLCSMYPEDCCIPVEDLVRYGFALKLFKGTKKVGDARVAAYSRINTLKECYLLMDSYDEEQVKMHDVIRDMAISIASRKEHPFMVRCDDEALGNQVNKDEHKSYPIISFECSSGYKLPGNLEFSELSLFRLASDRRQLLEIPDSFYQGMQNLKVVVLSHVFIHSLPTSLGCLSGLHTLSIHGCEVSGNMSVIGEMKNLEILSFKESFVEELPIEMGQLTHLKLLDLYGCTIRRIPPGVLSSLSNLEELYVGEVRGALLERITELSSLSNLVALSIYLDDNKLWPMNWTLENMKNFGIGIGLYIWSQNYMLTNWLCLSGIDVPIITESGLRMLLRSSKRLCLTDIGGLENISYDFGEENFECLTSLELEKCGSIEYLINATNGTPERAFPVLESLTLGNLYNFKQIFHIQSEKDSFSKTKVALTKIEELRLKDIYVKDCQSVEVIFDIQELTTVTSVVALPMLEVLNMQYLPNLIHVWKINTTSPVNFQGFQNLKSMKIKGCNNLRYLFPTCVAKLLKNLEKLEIKDCGAMENIVANEPKVHEHDSEGTSSGVRCLLPQLKVLKLFFLPKLRRLCPQSFTFDGTCLEELTIICCLNIEQHYYENAKNVSIIPSSTDIRLLNGKFILHDEGVILVEGMDEATDTWCGKVEIQGCLQKTKRITFLSCGKLLSIASSNLMGRLHNLNDMTVFWCDSVEAIFDLEGVGYEDLSVNLLIESLCLMFLPKLTHIWKNAPQQSHYFSQLKNLRIQNCDSLSYIFTISMARALVNLRKLVIKRCKKVEEIIVSWEEEQEDEESGRFFSKGCNVKLKHLPNLICFGPKEYCAKTLEITVTFCCKYKGPGDRNV